MKYDEMIKIAYEDIIDTFEKSAANRLFRDGLEGAKSAIQGRIDSLTRPVAEFKQKAYLQPPPRQRHYEGQIQKYLNNNPAANNAYHNSGYNINHQTLSDRLGQGRGTQLAEYTFERAKQGFKNNPIDNKMDLEWAGGNIKHNYRSLVHDLSNHKRDLNDIKQDAWKKLQRKKGLEERLRGQGLSPEAITAKMQDSRAKEIINRGPVPGAFNHKGYLS
jgi:hypothetical protein